METHVHSFSHPILTCSASHEWEQRLLKSDEEAWAAMNRVGVQLGRGIKAAYAMSSFPRKGLKVLGLIGKGHNGGDALLALSQLALEEDYLAEVSLVLSSKIDSLKPNTKRALDLLQERTVVEFLDPKSPIVATRSFDICLDGLLGMQFRPPLGEGLAGLLKTVNGSPNIRLRVAVDLPSGVGGEVDENAFRADVTFATGIFKTPLLSIRNAGTIRYFDIGFFDTDTKSDFRVVMDRVLDPLRAIRPAFSEKRQHGHLAIVAGSRNMPGALSMCVRAALQSGVGLVTVFAPESVVSQLACELPEAMWRTWPETSEGGLALEGLWQVKSILGRATALLVGPGMGTEAETQALLVDIGRVWDKPALLDADALRPDVVEAFSDSERILTPHEGEFERLSGSSDCTDDAIVEYAKKNGLVLVKKGSSTRISDGQAVYVNTTGNAVLSRGGSGDLLAGLMAGLLAQEDADAIEVACRAAYWHGKAADVLAVAKGQVAVRTTDLLAYLDTALRC